MKKSLLSARIFDSRVPEDRMRQAVEAEDYTVRSVE